MFDTSCTQASFSANLGGVAVHTTNTVATPVEIPQTLAITIDTPSRGKGPLKKGQKVTYTIVVTNEGPSTASAVVVQITVGPQQLRPPTRPRARPTLTATV